MIEIRKDNIPLASKKRTNIAMTPIYITIHSTANPTSTAKNERAWLTNPENKTETGFHYVVDEKEAIECIPPNEVAWHAGDARGDGNMKSIGVEICESGNREKTLQNAIELTKHLMSVHKITQVVRHYDWSKKNCPRILNTTGDWSEWKTFLARLQEVTPTTTPHNYEEDLQFLLKLGIIKELDSYRVPHSPNIQSLITKAAQFIQAKEYLSAVNHLTTLGIITSPDYWKAQEDLGTQALILQISKHLRG